MRSHASGTHNFPKRPAGSAKRRCASRRTLRCEEIVRSRVEVCYVICVRSINVGNSRFISRTNASVFGNCAVLGSGVLDGIQVPKRSPTASARSFRRSVARWIGFPSGCTSISSMAPSPVATSTRDRSAKNTSPGACDAAISTRDTL